MPGKQNVTDIVDKLGRIALNALQHAGCKVSHGDRTEGWPARALVAITSLLGDTDAKRTHLKLVGYRVEHFKGEKDVRDVEGMLGNTHHALDALVGIARSVLIKVEHFDASIAHCLRSDAAELASTLTSCFNSLTVRSSSFTAHLRSVRKLLDALNLGVIWVQPAGILLTHEKCTHAGAEKASPRCSACIDEAPDWPVC